MYSFLHELLSDKKGGRIFTLFSAWHFLYIALTLAVILIAVLLLKKRDDVSRQRVIRAFIGTAFGLYIADLFLMPLAYGEIDIEKLARQNV